MHLQIPTEARLASRVVLVDEQNRVLFLRATEPLTKKTFWVMPGGGLDPGESFEDAASRELYEETGIVASVGLCVWYRRHKHKWNGHDADQFEKFFVVKTNSREAISGPNPDNYTSDSRWWTIQELMESTEDFAPRRISILLPTVLGGAHSDFPIDCGV